MSFVQARLRSRFSSWLHGLKGKEKEDMDAILADIRMMNNPSVHQELGNARKYTAGFWVRDLPPLDGIDRGGNRLIYSDISQDDNEVRKKMAGHVEVLGIGDPHTSSGFKQVNKLSEVSWVIH